MNCIIALDLGTTAFKCAPVNEDGLLAEPTTVSYNLDYDAGAVTFEPEAYVRVAAEALAGAVQSAKAAGLTVQAIGISSQAQTYIPLDFDGRPMQKATVWTDGRAVEEAREVAQRIPDFEHHSGFKAPLPELFMPKVRHFARHGGIPLERVWKFPLLNEYIVYRLTGSVYGDTNIQGMSGFYHITRREWSQDALDYAGIRAGQLAETAPAARIGRPLAAEWRARLGIDAVPVYACGNDQSTAAAGAGLSGEGDIVCNFGTAMVVYALKDELPGELLDKQIAGISPLTGRYFLLGVEAECGNVLDWAHRSLYAGRSFTDMMEEALAFSTEGASLPQAALPGGGRIELRGLTVGHEGRHIVRALLELYADTFGVLLRGVAGAAQTKTLYAAGGLSRSDAWLDFLNRRFNIRLQRSTVYQPGLVGVARIIRQAQEA
jgi:sugar (pentulose or hexulose) kinase